MSSDICPWCHDEITKLKEDLATSEQNVKDFEMLALTWKSAYDKEVPKLKKTLMEKDQVISSLEDQIKEMKEWAKALDD